VTVLQQRDFAVYIIDRIDYEIGIPAQQFGCLCGGEENIAAVELHPWCDGSKPLAETVHFRRPDICERSDSMSIQRRKRDLVEVYKPNMRCAGARERGDSMRAYAANTDDYYECFSEFGETFVGQEDAVARQLFEDQIVIVVASFRTRCERSAAFVFFT
jgi:hypothetical protein